MSRQPQRLHLQIAGVVDSYRFDELVRLQRARRDGAKDRDFLRADWTYNNKRFRLKARPDLVVDLTRNTDSDSVLLGSWHWMGPPGVEGGPCRTVEDCLRDANRALGLPWTEAPKALWQGVKRTAGGPRLHLVP